MNSLFTSFPVADITLPVTKSYALIDAFSQGKLDWIFFEVFARNMGKMTFG